MRVSEIKSFSYNQQEILSWIQKLYCPGGFDLDPTWGYGGFYKSQIQTKINGDEFPEVRRPRLYFDRYRDGMRFQTMPAIWRYGTKTDSIFKMG